jgi:Polyketide cyclase / dehydrase and lipid transport
MPQTLRLDRLYAKVDDLHVPTIELSRAETRSVSIAARPEAVLRVVGDPARLPDWAPRFARAATPTGDDRWLIDDGETTFTIIVPVSPPHGTVDLIRPATRTAGAFTRVVPNGDGSEYVFTLLFPPGVPDDAVERQMLVVEDELDTVRVLAEALT